MDDHDAACRDDFGRGPVAEGQGSGENDPDGKGLMAVGRELMSRVVGMQQFDAG
jgi:hypothetical protein